MALVLATALLGGLGACAITPPMPRADRPAPGQPVPGVRAVAGQISVTGHRGRLPPEQRERLLRRVGGQGSSDLVQRHLAAMAGFGELDLYAGNEVQLLVDGPATFAAMLEAIAQARHTILLESYIIEDADISQRLAALLAKKRAEGVQVLVIYDALGSFGTDDRYFQALRDAGIATCAFNPVNPVQRLGYWDITHRDHRKILVIDRDVGFTGGINISAVYASGSFGRQRRPATAAGAADRVGGGVADGAQDLSDGWRDTQLRLRGPAVAALDDLVRATWVQQACGEALAPLPPARPVPAAVTGRAMGRHLMRIVPASPDDDFNRIYALLLTAIDASQRSVHLTMAYFAPGQDMVDALCEAAQRGVDVRLVLPSLSDFVPVLHAGRSYYQRLLDAGVKVYELQDAVLHAKTAVIDGVVSTVGSSNMDWRSFAGNNEVNAVVIGEDFGDAMSRMFQRDLQVSQAIDAAVWQRRPLWQRAKESLARLFEAWW